MGRTRGYATTKPSREGTQPGKSPKKKKRYKGAFKQLRCHGPQHRKDSQRRKGAILAGPNASNKPAARTQRAFRS